MDPRALGHRGRVLNQGYRYIERIDARGDRLDVLDYLAARYPRASRAEWAQRISDRAILLDGAPTRAAVRLRRGQQLVWERPPWHEPDVPTHFDVLYEDASILVVDKPVGLPTNPGGGLYLENTLLHRVRAQFGDASPVHRLGRGTSGAVVFARTPAANKAMGRQWSRHASKVYLARVARAPAWHEMDIDVPIGQVPHRVMGRVAAACDSGRPSRTIVRRARPSDPTLIEAELMSGRPHQIRIHLAAVGSPLEGEPFYTAHGRPRADSRLISDIGFLLHAWRIGFVHPETGHRTEVEAPPPDWCAREH